jgi:putative protease
MEVLAGKVLTYYRKIGVASIKVSTFLEVGGRIHVKGHTTDFDQKVESLHINHRHVSLASAGEIAGLRVNDYVRKNDCIYRMEGDRPEPVKAKDRSRD